MIASVAALALAGVFLLVVVVANSQDPNPGPPEEIVAVIPEDNGQLLRQDSVGVTTLPTWSCELVIDGVRIPEAEIEGTEELGECLFRPGEDKQFETLEPGLHTARVTVFDQANPDDNASYSWQFTTK